MNVSREELVEAVRRIREKMTLENWAWSRGYHYQTVVKLIHGWPVKLRDEIISDLVAEGYLSKGVAVSPQLVLQTA